jgi:hypothetical protein
MPPASPERVGRVSLKRRVVGVLLPLAVAGLVWMATESNPPPATTASVATTTAEALPAQTPTGDGLTDPRLQTPDPALAKLSDADRTRMLLGTWTSTFHGRQQIENRADGTAALQIDFDFLPSLLYGSRMDLELVWKIERGVLTNTIQSGQPKANVDRLISDFGDGCRYRMLELTADHLRLQEIDDPAAFHTWKRVKAVTD